MDLKERPQKPFSRHPWEVVRARFFGRLLAEALPEKGPARILDVGAGDGFLAASLAGSPHRPASVTCWDPGYTDDDLAQLPSRSPWGDTDVCFYRDRPSECYSVILLLDVLEHVEDDQALLQSLVSANLAPGGKVMLSVPSWRLLYSGHDERLGHHRRYDPDDARRLVQRAGLVPERCGGLFHSLLAVRILEVGLAAVGLRREPGSATLEWRHGRLLSATARAVLLLEAAAASRLGRAGVDLPGLSWWALASRGGP